MGRCMLACGGGCPAGTICGSDNLCLPSCTAAGQCARGRYCFLGRCSAWCQGDADCFSGHCDPWSGRCTETADPPTGARTGEACLVDEDCRSGFCLSNTCASLCAITNPHCPEDEGCVSFSAMSIEAGVCYQRCDHGETCRDPSTSCGPVSDPSGNFCI